jgi:hypothetical protein
MSFFDKFIPNEIKKPINKFIVRPLSKLSDKLIPNELRFLAPYAAGIGSLMLPPGMSPLVRGLIASGMSGAGQIAADETPIESIDDLNALSMALAGGLGALGSDSVSGSMRGGIDSGTTAREAAIMKGSGVEPTTGFLQGAENVGREGIASLSDMVTGGRQTLADIGKNPGNLFQKKVPGMKGSFPVLQDAAAALTPTVTLATGDVAYETAIDAANEFDRIQREEMEQAGMAEDAIANARRAAIREAMEVNNFSEEEILDVFEEIGLKDGGIASLKDGGMLNFGGREMDLRGGGFVPIGKKERADDVPARLSKNEFVMTADAVRAAGGGSVNKGAQRMYDIMNRLEARA